MYKVISSFCKKYSVGKGMYRSHGVRKEPVNSTHMFFVRRFKASKRVVLTLKHEMLHVQVKYLTLLAST